MVSFFEENKHLFLELFFIYLFKPCIFVSMKKTELNFQHLTNEVAFAICPTENLYW